MSPSGSSVVRFSTDDFAPRDRFTVWRDAFGRGLLNVEVEPASDGPFRATATMRAIGPIKLLFASSSGVIYRRPPGLVQNDDLIFSLGATKGSLAQQRSRETCAAEDGDALLMLGAEWSMVARSDEGSLLALRLPRAALMTSVRNVEDLYCRRIPGDLSVVAAVAALSHGAGRPGRDRHARVAAVHRKPRHRPDRADARRDARGRAIGRRAACGRHACKSIKHDIVNNLSDETLSVRTIAARHKVTPRYVQRLFEEAGSTFTEYVVEQRLVRAHRLLTAARSSDQTLTAIAFEVGFGDLSYFNRAFRRRFGAPPSDVRAQADRIARAKSGTFALTTLLPGYSIGRAFLADDESQAG